MAKAEISQVLSIDKDQFFDAVVKYEDYPQFVKSCKKTEVERKAPGHSRVKYSVDLMRELYYILDHHEDREKGVITWKLIESDLLKANQGTWNITSAGPGQTSVKYEIDIEFNIPVPGFILGKLIKGSLPGMLKDFEKKAKG